MAQPLAQKQFDQYVISLQSVDAAQYSHFRVQWNSGQTVDFSVFGVLGDVSSAARLTFESYNATRLCLSEIGSGALFIVDPRSGQAIDTLTVSGIEFSPDSRFIAMTNYVGRSNPDDGNLYLVYDLTLSPEQNRMNTNLRTSVNVLSAFNVGWAVFPNENRSAHSYAASPQEVAAIHSPQSELYWLDSRTLAFADYASGTSKLVLIRLGDGVHQIQEAEQVIDPAAVLDVEKLDADVPPASYLSVTKIEFVKPGDHPTVRLSFPGDNPKYRAWWLDLAF
ncbi:MAG TPA: hypothetical protein VFA27_17445 [Vicinamibacterales bacterium]|nr:hypothetical protein [Vicinamibacterales bacterium]